MAVLRYSILPMGAKILLLLAWSTADAQTKSEFPDYDDISARGYFEEVLLGYGTPRTHRFDSYTEGRYSGETEDLIPELFRTAPLYGLHLKGVVVIGPLEPALWTHYTITFFDSGNCTTVNILEERHGRITEKMSRCIDSTFAEASLRRFASFTTLGVQKSIKTGCVVFADSNGMQVSELPCYSLVRDAAIEPIVHTLNELADRLETTYAHPH